MAFETYTKNHYGVVSHSVLNNFNLSLKAKGLFVYLQSKPDGWEFSFKNILAQSKDKKTAIKKAIKELEEAGYLIKKPIKSRGREKKYDYFLVDNF